MEDKWFIVPSWATRTYSLYSFTQYPRLPIVIALQ